MNRWGLYAGKRQRRSRRRSFLSRILHVFPTLDHPYGWARQVASGIGAELVKRDHFVQVIATSANIRAGELSRTYEWRGANFTEFRRNGGQAPVRLLRTSFLSQGMWAFLRKSAASFDVIHIHTLYSLATIMAAMTARKAGVPYVIAPHGSLDPFTHYRRGRLRKEVFLKAFHSRDFGSASAIHFVSDREMELAQAFGQLSHGAVINLAVDPISALDHPLEHRFRESYPQLGDGPLVLYVGRISYTKGLDLLVNAFAILLKNWPSAHLALVGPDYENYTAYLKGRITALGIDQQVIFTGMISEARKAAAFEEADIFVLPSYTEAFGVALLEAMGAGCPVVVSDQAALAKPIKGAGAGVAVQLEPHAIAAALTTLLDDGQLRSSIASAGIDLIRTHFNWTRVGNELESLYGVIQQTKLSASKYETARSVS